MVSDDQLAGPFNLVRGQLPLASVMRTLVFQETMDKSQGSSGEDKASASWNAEGRTDGLGRKEASLLRSGGTGEALQGPQASGRPFRT